MIAWIVTSQRPVLLEKEEEKRRINSPVQWMGPYETRSGVDMDL